MLRVFVLFIGMLMSGYTLAFSYTVEITEQQLQASIDKKMPMTKKKFLFSVTLSEPKVSLLKTSDEISIFAHISVLAPGGYKGSGTGVIMGAISYKAETATFYFEKPKLTELNIHRLPEKLSPTIKQLLQNVLTRSMSSYPVYQLNDKDLKQKFAKSLLKAIKIEDGKMIATLSFF